MTWENANNEVSATRVYLKVRKDESPTGVFVGAPVTRKVVWIGGRTVQYDPRRHTKRRPTVVVTTNFFRLDTGRMHLLSGGSTLITAVADAAAKCRLGETVVTLSRTGDGTQTRYSVTIVRPLSDSDKAAMASSAQLEIDTGDDDPDDTLDSDLGDDVPF